MKTRMLSLCLAVPVWLAAAGLSFAQAFGPGYQNFIDTLAANRYWERSVKSAPEDKEQPGSSSGSISRPIPSQPVVRDTALTPEQIRRAVQFRSSGTRLLLNEYVEAFGGTVEDKAETKAILTGYLNRFDADAAALGVPNDVPLAIVTVISINSAVYADTPFLSSNRIMELRNSMAIELTRGGALAKLTDEEKQRFYELSVMTAGLVQTLCEKAKKERNTEELKNCKVVTAQNLKRYGVEPK